MIIKIPNSRFKIEDSSETGVTLLMAVMIMATLVIISTTVAVLAVQEIRAGRAQQVSESALNAAKTGAEEGLWIVKRSSITNLPDCPSGISKSYSASKSYINYCKSFKGQTYTLVSGTPTTILLYNPNDPDGDISLTNFVYTTLTVTNTGGFAVNVDVSRIDGPVIGNFQVIPSSAPYTLNIPSVASPNEARMLVTLQSTGNTTALVTTNKGLPSNLNIASTACSTKTAGLSGCGGSEELYTRKIEVNVSN